MTLPALDTTTTAPAETTTTTGAVTLWAVDTCLDLGSNATANLPYAPYGDELAVDCGGPHTHELYFVATLEEGPEAPFPANLNDRLWAGCYAAFTERMGYASTQSTLDLTLYLPDAEEWASGERYHGCVLHQPGTQIAYRPLVGSVFDHADDYRWVAEPGTCYAEVDLTVLLLAEAVPCDGLHTVETLGDVEPDVASYPGESEYADLAAEACQNLLEASAAQDIDELPLIAFTWRVLVPEGEWDAGGRSVKCYVLAGSEEALLLMTGSVADGTLEVVLPDDTISA